MALWIPSGKVKDLPTASQTAFLGPKYGVLYDIVCVRRHANFTKYNRGCTGRSGPAGLVSDWATGRPVLLYTALRFSPKRVFQKIDARTRREGVRAVLVRRRSSCQRVVKGAGRENKTLWNLD